MEVTIEFISKTRSLLGASYMKGEAFREDNKEKVIFHEFGIGLIFVGLFFTFITKGES
jgi:hypothetical protein